VAEKPDEPVAQIAPLEQHEHDEREHQTRRPEWTNERPQPAEAGEPGSDLWRYDDRARSGSRRRRRRAEVPLEIFDGVLKLFDRTSLPGAANVGDLGPYVCAIARYVRGQVLQLSREPPGRQAQQREHERDREQHCRDTPDPALEPRHRRSKHEGEQNRQGEWHEYGLCPVEDRHDQNAAGEYGPGS
jgi:hypothetical protein